MAEVILQPTRLDIENDDEVEASKGDLAAQLADSHVVVEEGSRSEPVEDVEEACCQSIDMAIPEFTPALEGGNLKSLCEAQTAEARVSLECNTTVEVAQNLVDVTRKGDSCAEATITLEKSGVSNPQEKCETELSGYLYISFLFNILRVCIGFYVVFDKLLRFKWSEATA